MSRLHVFLLDDSLDMHRLVERLVEKNGGTLHKTRCLAEAVELLSHASIEINIVLIDLMIPLEKSTLPTIDDLLTNRVELSRIVIRKARTDEERKQLEDAKLNLDQIDRRLGELIPVDGGLQFLETEAAKKLTNDSGRKIAIFSARRPDHKGPGENETLQEKATRILGRPNGFDEWFEKPVGIRVLEDWLQSVFRSDTNGSN